MVGVHFYNFYFCTDIPILFINVLFIHIAPKETLEVMVWLGRADGTNTVYTRCSWASKLDKDEFRSLVYERGLVCEKILN